MPEAWSKLLSVSNISPSEQKQNPQAVIDVLKFYDSNTKEKDDDKFMNFNKPGSRKFKMLFFVRLFFVWSWNWKGLLKMREQFFAWFLNSLYTAIPIRIDKKVLKNYKVHFEWYCFIKWIGFVTCIKNALLVNFSTLIKILL